LSKIIRQTKEAPPVFIGERHEETILEAQAEQTLGGFFPTVSYVTVADGAKLIPLVEVVKFKESLDQECEKVHRQGTEEGYAKGMEEGLTDARRTVQQFEQAIRDAVSQRESLLSEAKQKVLDLVLQIARKVTFDAINVDREATVTMIENVIDRLIDRSSLKIKVNPDFLPIVEQQMNRFLSGSTSIKELKFEPDPRVRFGGCFIETPTGDIDARLESQFEVIEETMLLGEDES